MEQKKIGTVEPIYKEIDVDTFAFMVGAVKKYGSKAECYEDLMKYLRYLVEKWENTQLIDGE